MWYIGIDPGSKGAICLLNPEWSDKPDFLDLTEDDFNLYNHLYHTILRQNVTIALEEVHSLGNMSAKSNFTFGGEFRRIKTILNILKQPYEMVQPKKWQAAVGIPAKKDRPEGVDLKVIVAEHAHSLYPEASLYGPRGGLKDGRSDALMIAHYLLHSK